MCESLAFDCDEGHFLEWHLLVCLWVQHDSVSIWFCFRTSRKLFNPNEAWQQAVFWILQKHSYKNKVACHSLCRTSRDYQGLCGVVWWFFSERIVCHFGEKGICLFILFVSWLPDLYPYLHIWFLSALLVYLSSSGMSQRFSHYSHTLCTCLNSSVGCTHTCVSWREGYVMYLLGSAPEQSWRASSEVRFTVSVARLNWGLSWAAGWSNTFTSDYPASCLKIGIDHLTRCVWISRYLFNSEHKDVCSHSAVPAQLCCSCTRQGMVTRQVTVQGRCW